MRRTLPSLFAALILVAAGGAQAAVTIHSTAGEPVSRAVGGTQAPTERLAPDATTIDLWCCGADTLDWGLNDLFYWATAFDTDDIAEPYTVTEVRWYADGGETEDYWIAPDAGGLPDTSQAVYLGGQSVPDSPFQLQSFDASGVGAIVDPGRVYWFIRASSPPGAFGFDLTWRSSTNPDPPVQDPVAISMNFDSGWSKWVTGLNWHMEYQILGDPVSGPVLTATGTCPGSVSIQVIGATPGGQVPFVASPNLGTFTLPGGPCAGTDLGLANPRLLGVLTADGGGNISRTVQVPPAACGLYLQALDVATCDPTNVEQLP